MITQLVQQPFWKYTIARKKIPSPPGRGRQIKSIAWQNALHPHSLAIEATVCAWLRRQISSPVPLARHRLLLEDIRLKQLKETHRSLLIFLVDASESMLAENRLHLAKGFALTVLNHVNRNRSALALVVVAGEQAQILLHPTRSLQIIREQISNIPCTGATPLADGLNKVLQIIRAQKRKNPLVSITWVLFSDGEANVPLVKGGSIEDEIAILARKIKQENIRTIIVTSDRPIQRQPIIELLKRELAESLTIHSVL